MSIYIFSILLKHDAVIRINTFCTSDIEFLFTITIYKYHGHLKAKIDANKIYIAYIDINM